jgi:hypothetical protein
VACYFLLQYRCGIEANCVYNGSCLVAPCTYNWQNSGNTISPRLGADPTALGSGARLRGDIYEYVFFQDILAPSDLDAMLAYYMKKASTTP